MSKVRVNFALTEQGHTLLRALADNMGLSMTAALEVILRDRAKADGIRTAYITTEPKGTDE